MGREKPREIASQAGLAPGGRDLGHVDRSEAGRRGGEAVSRDRAHMAEIGRKGGLAVARDREYMAAIGRKGGEARGTRARHNADEDGGSA